MYKTSGIICPYCGFKDVKKINGKYWCCQCDTKYIMAWIDGVI
jgi:ribosomal protein L37AE/L43A